MGVYVHIPFCARKCHYCDFHSIVVGEADFPGLVDSYLVSLRREALYYRKLWANGPLDSLFFGGGTPTLIPPEKLAQLIAFLLAELPFTSDPEVTIEANPQSVTPQGAEFLAGAGVNRVSLGAQAFQNELLTAIGRLHRAEDIGASVRSLRSAGIREINLDLMFGLPGQDLAHWRATLEAALALEPTHLSCYALILEPGTPLASWHEQGLVELPGEDEQADMYQLAREVLQGAGYEHYEISNFCLPGHRCRHNLLYWHNLPFIGLGSGATGYLGGCRYQNAPDVEGYIRSWAEGKPPYLTWEEVGRDQEMDETMMVGMRLLEGVSEAEFRRRFQVSLREVYGEAVEQLLQQGLAEEKDGRLRVTELGLFLENRVSAAFLR